MSGVEVPWLVGAGEALGAGEPSTSWGCGGLELQSTVGERKKKKIGHVFFLELQNK